MPAVQEELETLIRARYPIVYVLSWEEERVEAMVRVVSNEVGRKVYVWSLTSGMQPSVTVRGGGTLAPELEALTLIHGAEENAVFILRDFHPYIGDYRVIRLLRDLGETIGAKRQTILILGPTLKLPTELEKQVTLFDFGLPTADEISDTLHDVLLDVRDNTKADLNLTAEQREAIIHAAQGLTLTEIKNVFIRSLVRSKTLDVSEIMIEKQQIIRKSGILEYHPADISMADVGGLGLLKDWLRKRRVAFSVRAQEFGLPAPKGVLLLGVQGGGKSLSAKAVAGMWNLPLIRLDIGRVFGSLVGASEENMRKALAVAESVAPCILWIDELEKGLSGMQSSGMSDGGTTARVFSKFLTWMQEKTAAVFVVATANSVNMLPPELLRKGRFDEIFFIDLPTTEERKEIINIHLTKRKRDPKAFQINKIAEATHGFSGAEIEQAIVAALFTAFDSDREVTTDDIIAEATATKPLSVTRKEDIQELREWAHQRARPASKPPAPEIKARRGASRA